MEKDKIKIRQKWPSDMDPSTRVHKVKTDYNRGNNRQEIQRALEEAELDDADLDFNF